MYVVDSGKTAWETESFVICVSPIFHSQAVYLISIIDYNYMTLLLVTWVRVYIYQFLFNVLNTIILASKHLFLNILTYFIQIVIIFMLKTLKYSENIRTISLCTIQGYRLSSDRLSNMELSNGIIDSGEYRI